MTMSMQFEPPRWLDLEAGANAMHIDLSDLPSLSAADRDAAITTWQGRMLNEFVSARVFEALARQIHAAEIGEELVSMAQRFAADERRHGFMCGAVVQALGGSARAPVRPLAAVPLHADCGPLEGLLRNVLSISCLAETVAVALITAERVECNAPSLFRLLGEILADEVRHARFGWRLLDAAATHMSSRLRHALGQYLAVAFAHLEQHELRFLAGGPSPSASAQSVGVCDGHSARTIFYATVHDVIIPKLEERGLPAARAWRHRDLAAPMN